MLTILSGLFIGGDDGRPPKSNKENIVALRPEKVNCYILIQILKKKNEMGRSYFKL